MRFDRLRLAVGCDGPDGGVAGHHHCIHRLAVPQIPRSLWCRQRRHAGANQDRQPMGRAGGRERHPRLCRGGGGGPQVYRGADLKYGMEITLEQAANGFDTEIRVPANGMYSPYSLMMSITF